MCAYRDGDGLPTLTAATTGGDLVLTPGARELWLTQGARRVMVRGHGVAVEGTRRQPERFVARRIAVARDPGHGDLGLWLELDDGAVKRVFGAEPADDGPARRTLDALAAALAGYLADRAGGGRRASEIGRGLDKVLVIDEAARRVVYRRELFRDRAHRACEVAPAGADGPGEIALLAPATRAAWTTIVVGVDDLRFVAAGEGASVARLPVPWIGADDRSALARLLAAPLAP